MTLQNKPQQNLGGTNVAAIDDFYTAIGRLTAAETVSLADEAGISRRLAARARRGRLVGAETYLKLATTLQLDPSSGVRCHWRAVPTAQCHWPLLGTALFFE